MTFFPFVCNIRLLENRTFFPYLAAYIDGDGCFYAGTTIQNPKNILVFEGSLQVSSTKPAVLHEFQEKCGGFVRKRPDKARHKETFVWILKNSACLPVLKKIYPFMTDKRLQCFYFSIYLASINHNKFKKVSEKILFHRHDIINKIRKEKQMNNLISKEDIDHINTLQHTITPSEIDYPYLAGLIDSEGCFRIKKWKPKNRPNEVYTIALEIGNTKLPILPWLIQRFGGSCCFVPAKKNKKASAIWTLSAAALYSIIHKIFPFIRGKKEVCSKLIEFQETILPNGGDRHSELFHALFEKRREIRERIIQEVHDLNKKGS